MLPPASFSPMMPEPTTVASKRAEPSASASSLSPRDGPWSSVQGLACGAVHPSDAAELGAEAQPVEAA